MIWRAWYLMGFNKGKLTAFKAETKRLQEMSVRLKKEHDKERVAIVSTHFITPIHAAQQKGIIN